MSHPILKTACVVAGFAVAALAATSAQASDPAPQQSSTGSKVGIDAKTGKLRPLTAAESAQLDSIEAAKQQAVAAQAKKSSKTRTLAKGETLNQQGLISFVAKNGMTVVELDDSYMVDLQATVGADGKVVVSHGGEQIHNAVEASNE